ncbi:MAG: PEP-CTERM sorting domain-containing protein, partial [Acidobacteriota bacterium]|nr:PEP-CTERM sorting domain-containing protein [Acidobacteriota bacterium]
PCSVAEAINANSGNSGGTFNGLTATQLFGLLHISGPSFSVADATASAPYEHLAAVSVNGLLVGEDSSGRMLFELNLQGTGHLTLDGTASADGRSVSFSSALTEFSGTVTPTPEPSSLALLSIGSALAVFCFRRKKISDR